MLDEDTKSAYPRKPKPLSIRDKLKLNLENLCKTCSIELTDELLNDFPKKWRIFDDLACLSSTCLQNEAWFKLDSQLLYQTIASTLRCKRLAQENRIKSDEFRSPNVKLLLGYNNDTWVCTVNNGIKYTFDLSKSMFSAGNITEKLRIAKLNCENEVVIDLFAGVGYFILPFIIHAKANRAIACEWNPVSIEALKRNLVLNKCAHKCEILEGDNRLTCPKNIANRVNLGLIPTSEASWPVACKALRQDIGGRLHIHGNVDIMSKESHRQWAESTREKIRMLLGHDWKVFIEHIEYVKSYAPRVDHLVLDLLCKPS